MVGREDLMNAIALNSSVVNGARVVGPSMAGLLLAAVGEGWCFLLNGVSFVAVIVGLVAMRELYEHTAKKPTTSPIADIAEGFRFVVHHRPIRAFLLLLGLGSLMPYTILMPVFADRILGGGARELGILMGATGVGAVLGALLLASRGGMRGLGAWVASASFAFALSLTLFAFSRQFWLSAALLIPAGFSWMVQVSASNTLLQAMSPNDLRGRVMAAYSMMALGMVPFGSAIAGWAADRTSPQLTVAVGGGLGMLGTLVFISRLGGIRAEARGLIRANTDLVS
jgi:predicted MFS family arabinose efflux permease